MSCCPLRACGVFASFLLWGCVVCHVSAQPPAADAEPEAKLPTIADEPKTIDPAALMPDELKKNATREFSDSSLREVVAWLRDEQKLTVLVDQGSLAKMGLSTAEPVSDRLANEPIYLLLNRLRSLGLAWYYEDKIVHITSDDNAQRRATTLPHNVGDLLDAGYDMDSLLEVITTTVEPDHWDEVGGEGTINAIGDVLFVRQTDPIHRQVQGLLTALRGHARQTFINDPVQHVSLREKLDQNVSVAFDDTPLEAAVRELAESSKADIRLDPRGLRQVGVRTREPITLKLEERKLETVLQAMLVEFELTWILRDGVLWITSHDDAMESQKTAIYDVRDLCRDGNESDALIDAITSQTLPDSWDEVGGPGTIESAKPGTLVISHEERAHKAILQLLETYRQALRASKPRTQPEEDENEVITTYYRMHADVASGLLRVLPELVNPETWTSENTPDAVGRIRVVASEPKLAPDDLPGVTSTAPKTLLPQAVLIIRQTRGAHKEIANVIQRVESGDAFDVGFDLEGMESMGGFGGGFFSIPSAKKPTRQPVRP